MLCNFLYENVRVVKGRHQQKKYSHEEHILDDKMSIMNWLKSCSKKKKLIEGIFPKINCIIKCNLSKIEMLFSLGNFKFITIVFKPLYLTYEITCVTALIYGPKNIPDFIPFLTFLSTEFEYTKRHDVGQRPHTDLFYHKIEVLSNLTFYSQL